MKHYIKLVSIILIIVLIYLSMYAVYEYVYGNKIEQFTNNVFYIINKGVMKPDKYYRVTHHYNNKPYTQYIRVISTKNFKKKTAVTYEFVDKRNSVPIPKNATITYDEDEPPREIVFLQQNALTIAHQKQNVE
jgi:hypothetical protein